MYFVIIWVACILLSWILAREKNRSPEMWLLLAIATGPLALILVVVLPKINTKEQQSITPAVSPGGLREELNEIKNRFNSLKTRIDSLDYKINSLLGKAATGQMPAGAPPEEPSKTPSKEAVLEKDARGTKEFEANVGRFWLNKIGIVVFTLGIGFLISYTFRYFGPWLKIIFGYLVSAGLFFAGTKLERKEQFKNYGRVILGGGWAITYFTTYAMYHFDASRIINSQVLDLLFLAVVACGIIIHSLKYNSQELSSIALFIGYFTTTLGDVTYFTFFSSLFLAIAALVLVYRMQWVKVIFLGIALTYITHFFWVVKQIYFSTVPVGNLNVSQVYFLVNLSFLFIYWFVFTAGIHLLKETKEKLTYERLSAANFTNSLLFFLLAYPKLLVEYPQYKFVFVFGLGFIYFALALIMEKAKREALFTSNMLIAVSLMTLSLPLKLSPHHTSVIWLIEIPFLLAIGLIFDRKIFRFLGLGLSLILFFKVFAVDFYRGGYLWLLGQKLAWNKCLSFLGFLSSAISFYLHRHLKNRPQPGFLEEQLSNLSSALAGTYMVFFIWLLVKPMWLTFGLSLELLVIFILGYLLRDKFLRAYSLLLFLGLFFRFSFVDNYDYLGNIWKWSLISLELIFYYTLYFLYRKLKKNSLIEHYEESCTHIVFVLSTILLVLTIFRYILHPWTSLGLGAAGLLLFVPGFLSKDRNFRLAGFVVFAITILRVVFVDLAHLHIIYKIVSFIILGLLFLAVSFVYTKYNIGKQER